MPAGPILIFDKSMLQMLDRNEAMWLDNFFLSNITPLFFVETLADLEKEVRSGRTPEQVVGNLAYKTPDMQSSPAAHHLGVLQAELTGAQQIAMDGRIHRAGGYVATLGGQSGIIFRRTQEEEAFDRWQAGEFLDLDRQIAKLWRKNLSNISYDEVYQVFQKWFEGRKKPQTLAEVKSLADRFIEGNQENTLRFGMDFFGISEDGEREVVARWQKAGKPAIKEFAPYLLYLLSVDLFFYLAIAADHISRVRPSDKADNKVDIAYLYYLPFCMVFASNDNLHARVVPLFLRDDQTFVKGADLKSDLRRLNEYYSALPDEVTAQGVIRFADHPPTDHAFLVTQLWDKHLPRWRKIHDEKQPVDEVENRKIVEHINRLDKESQATPGALLTPDQMGFALIKRNVLLSKGDWRRFPPGVENAEIPEGAE
jgi:hypothetical protein